jgi:hypothetical protein
LIAQVTVAVPRVLDPDSQLLFAFFLVSFTVELAEAELDPSVVVQVQV